jgi:hypothetical protein
MRGRYIPFFAEFEREDRTKLRGELSCESSPLLSDFSKIWFGNPEHTDSHFGVVRGLQACAAVSLTLPSFLSL